MDFNLNIEEEEKQIDFISFYGVLSKENLIKVNKLNKRISYACQVLNMDFFDALEFARRE